jgi:hypothetical protein
MQIDIMVVAAFAPTIFIAGLFGGKGCHGSLIVRV